MSNPYFPDESIPEPQPRSYGPLPVRAIVRVALVLVVLLAALLVAVRLHDQDSQIAVLRQEDHGYEQIMQALIARYCPHDPCLASPTTTTP